MAPNPLEQTHDQSQKPSEASPQLRSAVELAFENNLSGKPVGDFDVVTWNLYKVFIQKNRLLGEKPEKAWRKAHSEARVLRDRLKSQKSSGTKETLFDIFSKLAREKKIGLVRLNADMTVTFVDRGGKVLENFDLRTLEKKVALQQTRTEHAALLADVEKSSSQEGLKLPQNLQNGLNFLKQNYETAGNYLKRLTTFEPLVPPRFPDFRSERTVSAVDAIRLTKRAPLVIETEHRDEVVCSSYATEIMAQAYGRQKVINAGLLKPYRNSYKPIDAWDFRKVAYRNGSLDRQASVAHLSHVVERRNGTFQLQIDDYTRYNNGILSFFQAADRGRVPAFITLFNMNTRVSDKVLADNATRRPPERSYNSHVVVCLGREEPQQFTAPEGKKSFLLHEFLTKQTGVRKEFQRFLKVTVQKANGDVLEIGENGYSVTLTTPDGKKTNLGNQLDQLKIEPGDTVSWQDVLVTDFFHGQERIIGLGQLASMQNMVFIDYFTMHGAERRENAEYQPVDFFQMDPAPAPSFAEQLKQKAGITDADVPYYVAAYCDLGIDANRIQPKDLLPIFDLQKLHETVDAKGGPTALRVGIQRQALEAYSYQHPDTVLVKIERGVGLWSAVSPFFTPIFQGQYALSNQERGYILDAIDQSCPNIDLSAVPPRFEAGDVLYLTHTRLREIADVIREHQRKEFSLEDYIRIIQTDDSPLRFAQECFDAEVQKQRSAPNAHTEVQNQPDSFRFDALTPLERDYVLKAFQADNKEVDIRLVGEANKQQYARFRIGDRMIFRKVDLNACIYDIALRREAQKPDKNFAGPDAVNREGWRIILPNDMRSFIDTLYPSNNLEDGLVHNLLYYVYATEQMRSVDRKIMKNLVETFVPDALFEVKSKGVFQLRVTQADIELSGKKIQEMGYEIPSNFEEFKELIASHKMLSTIVAGERLRQSLRAFISFLQANGEDLRHQLDQNFAVMVLSSYNRSPGRVFRAVFQNWAYNLAETAGVTSDVTLGEIDGTDKDFNPEDLQIHILSTFRRVMVYLRDSGKVAFDAKDDDDLLQMFEHPNDFVRSPAFQKIQAWYRTTNSRSRGLEFVFSSKEIQRGDDIFYYGTRFLDPAHSDQFYNHMWGKTFAQYGELKDVLGRMNSPYTPEPFEKEKEDVPFLLAEQRKKENYQNLLTQSGIRDCFEGDGGNLAVRVKDVPLFLHPRIDSAGSLSYGTKMAVKDVEIVDNEYWMKVQVLDGPSAGKDAYVLFQKPLFLNEHPPSLNPSFEAKLAKYEKSSDRPIPGDSRKFFQEYLNFLQNVHSPQEAKYSADLMNTGLLTAVEVQDPDAVQRIRTIAHYYGYDGKQPFFGVLLKNGAAGLRGQKLFVIDSQSRPSRVLSFSVSTGRARSETPVGKYSVYSQGFLDVGALGAHMGAYAEKNRNAPRITDLKSVPARASPSITTAMMQVTSLEGKRAWSGDGSFIHGTNREDLLGTKASSGGVRMANLDTVYLTSLLNGHSMEFWVLDSLPATLNHSLGEVATQ